VAASRRPRLDSVEYGERPRMIVDEGAADWGASVEVAAHEPEPTASVAPDPATTEPATTEPAIPEPDVSDPAAADLAATVLVAAKLGTADSLSGRGQAGRTPARRGKRAVAFWLDPAAHKQLRTLALRLDTNLQALMEEACNNLFRQHGMHRIAHEARAGAEARAGTNGPEQG